MQFFDDDRSLADGGIEAVDSGRQFEFGFETLVVEQNAVAGIGEPDAPIGMDDDIVGRIQTLALEPVQQHSDGSVVLGAGDTAAEMLAGDQATLAVSRVAIAVIRGLTEYAGLARGFVPLHDAVVGDVAEEQETAVAEVDRTLGPARTRPKSLDYRVGDLEGCEAIVQDFDGGVGVADDGIVPGAVC